MKRLVNGVQVELSEGAAAEIQPLHDRLMVRTLEGSFSALAVREGDKVYVSYQGRQYTIEKAGRTKSGGRANSGEMKAPMPGMVVDVISREGARVSKGDKLLVLEAMKVQQPYNAPFDGTVKQLPVKKGQQVNEGELLVLVEPVA